MIDILALLRQLPLRARVAVATADGRLKWRKGAFWRQIHRDHPRRQAIRERYQFMINSYLRSRFGKPGRWHRSGRGLPYIITVHTFTTPIGDHRRRLRFELHVANGAVIASAYTFDRFIRDWFRNSGNKTNHYYTREKYPAGFSGTQFYRGIDANNYRTKWGYNHPMSTMHEPHAKAILRHDRTGIPTFFAQFPNGRGQYPLDRLDQYNADVLNRAPPAPAHNYFVRPAPAPPQTNLSSVY